MSVDYDEFGRQLTEYTDNLIEECHKEVTEALDELSPEELGEFNRQLFSNNDMIIGKPINYQQGLTVEFRKKGGRKNAKK